MTEFDHPEVRQPCVVDKTLKIQLANDQSISQSMFYLYFYACSHQGDINIILILAN